MNKLIYKSLFNDLFSVPCEIKFWDGEIVKIGKGDSRFRIIFNERIYKREIFRDASLVFGEGYMTKKIEIEGDLQEVIEAIYCNKNNLIHKTSKKSKLFKKISNNIKKSKDNVHFHYDIGNDFYRLWLDETMTYSCAYFKSENDSLIQAQKNKVDHILRKLHLKEGMTLLDIGCGWGELITTVAREYKVKALGITLSSEQYHKVVERIEKEGLKDLVEVQIMDYREIKNRKFDRILSVGMLEHVGKNHLCEYFTSIRNLLTEDGISLLHTITGIEECGTNSWINKYIFPGGYIPAIQELVRCIYEESFYLVDVESLRRHYGRTLEHWARNFENVLDEVRKTKDEQFIRMWRLYLDSSAASFNCGCIDIHQFLFTKSVNNNLPWTREYMYH